MSSHGHRPTRSSAAAARSRHAREELARSVDQLSGKAIDTRNELREKIVERAVPIAVGVAGLLLVRRDAPPAQATAAAARGRAVRVARAPLTARGGS